MSKLIDKIIAANKTKRAATLEKSEFLKNKDVTKIDIPALAIAASGEPFGGFQSGLLTIAGPSKHFKSIIMLNLMRMYLDEHKDSIAILYDSEFGSSLEYFASVGIDIKPGGRHEGRIIHSPITDVEELKFDISSTIQEISRGDKVFIGIDSVGNLASKKEVDDALDGKSVADMSRAKQLKSLFRIVTPHLSMKNIPMVVVNHVYKDMGLFPKDIVSGGTGIYLSSNDIWIMGRQQEKDGKEVVGFNFIINIEKSRTVREKSKIPLEVTFEGGIDYYSGLLDIALEGEFIVKPKNGWYQLNGAEGSSVRESDTGPLLQELLEGEAFPEYIRKKYKLVQTSDEPSEE